MRGQLCYEADLNQFRDLLNWRDAVQEGLSLVIDTNDEYDVKNILEKQSVARNDQLEIFPIYKQSRNFKSFKMFLQTISMTRLL